MNLKNLSHPRHFLLQWHITERCNLRCKHCYQDDAYLNNEMDTEGLYKVLDQFIEILKTWRAKGHINVTGGEPFVRKDFFNLLERFYRYRNLFSFGILTNGLFVTKEVAKRLKKLGVQNVQISIEGMKKINDEIRGKGTFEKIVRAAEILVRRNIHTTFSFTSSKTNYKDFFNVVKLGEEIGIDMVWTDRLVPWGRGRKMKELMLEPLELKEFYQSIDRVSKTLLRKKSKTHVATSRTLYFLATGNRGHVCPAGNSLITIMPNGDVFPCRRLPKKVGNVTQKSLFDIYHTSSFLKKLRNPPDNKICVKCLYLEKCRGGARCISYAYFRDAFASDPQCWIAFKKLPR